MAAELARAPASDSGKLAGTQKNTRIKMTEPLVEPKIDIDAFNRTIVRRDKYKRIDGETITVCFDAAGHAIGMGMGDGPYFMQFFPFEYTSAMLDYNKAKAELETADRLEREAKADAKRLATETAQAEKDARRLAMKALHAKPE
jgi:hypothetical protein